MNKNTSIIVLFCTLLPLFLVLFSYKAVLFFTPLTESQEETLQFLDGDLAEVPYPLTPEERSHLADVERVMTGINAVFYALLLALTLLLTYTWKQPQFQKKLFRFGGITTLAFGIILLFFILFSFTSSFTLFHQLFFPQGNWLFPESSFLIQMFPIHFFTAAARNIFLVLLGLGSLFILLSLLWKHDSPS
ncbi:MAG TPA: DUF1461 domain-containing protein [Candidatus Nanoarchaeia archaeon]|nr:DUF1461 domain-containing protein [Candidatus Nanoarchaeia archaeon]